MADDCLKHKGVESSPCRVSGRAAYVLGGPDLMKAGGKPTSSLKRGTNLDCRTLRQHTGSPEVIIIVQQEV